MSSDGGRAGRARGDHPQVPGGEGGRCHQVISATLVAEQVQSPEDEPADDLRLDRRGLFF